MEKGTLILAASAAYFSGRGYFVDTNFTIPGTNIVIDLAAVMPRMRELKPRLRRGFAPTGILTHMIGGDWVSFNELVNRTGYKLDFVGTVLEEAAQENWVELDVNEEGPRCRIKDYRVPARECAVVFLGSEELESKLWCLRSIEGCYSSAHFVFPYDVDGKTIDLIANVGGGLIRYHQCQGIFQELVPAESYTIEDMKCFALLVEKVLYDNVWYMAKEII